MTRDSRQAQRSEIVPVDPLHIRELCEALREREAAAFRQLHQDPERMIAQEVATSFMVFAGVVDGEVIALGGVKCPGMLSDEAYAWLICSERIEEFPITFARSVLKVFGLVKQRFRTIWGLVAADFAASVHWLEWMGFTVEPPDEAGARLFWYGQRPVRN